MDYRKALNGFLEVSRYGFLSAHSGDFNTESLISSIDTGQRIFDEMRSVGVYRPDMSFNDCLKVKVAMAKKFLKIA